MDDATVAAEVAAEDAADEAARPGSSTTRALARAGLIVTVLFLASRILGYVRTVAIAAAFPDVGDLAPFYAAFRIPDLLFQLVAAGALSSALIPIVASLLEKDEEARAWRVVSTVTTLMLAALVVLAALVLLFAPGLVAVMAPGFDEAQLAKTTELTRIMVLSPLFLAAGAVATSVLNSRGRFASAAMAPLIYNLAIIGSALFLTESMGITGLAYGVVAGAVGHVLVQVPSVLRMGVRIRPRLELSDDQARLALLLMVPRAIGLGATQLVFLVLTSLATTLGDEAVPVFNFAFAMLQIPIGVIGVPLGVVLLPSLSRAAADGATDGFTRLLVRGLAILAFVMIGIAGLGIVVSEDLVRILFSVAGISETAIEATGLALAVFLVGLTAHSLIAVLARAFYALKDTKTPVLAALGAVAANILLANVLVGPLGLNGLALAIALSAWLETLALAVFMRGRVPGYGAGVAYVGGVMLRTLVVTVAGAAVGYGIEQVLLGAWGEDPGFALLVVRAGLAVACGGLVIVAGAFALRIAELRTIVGVVVDLIARRGRA
ncbi:MAG TPA: murein biosynthesis integral membrane protein MurJ [Candidatus Limnocylindrales bacterium]|nr:murein biosynthesis integral membrane protein MurJ [Candidatus Limnocylindrales bacterium]